MSDYLALVDAELRPELAALATLDQHAALRRLNGLTHSARSFARLAPRLAAGLLARKTGAHGSWVWSVGNAHLEMFTTLAVGRGDAEGVIPVTYDISEADDEHAAPWRWDLVRLFASLALAKPDQKGSAFTALIGRALDGYQTALALPDEVGGMVADAATPELPPALVALLARESSVALAAAHRTAQVVEDGEASRLRLGAGLAKDLSARAFFLPALGSLYDQGRLIPIDLARREPSPTEPAETADRRRWLVLAREKIGPRAERLRLLEIIERPPSALAGLVRQTPFPPLAGPALSHTVALGGDPFQRLVHGPAATYLVRTACHCRSRLDPTTLEEPEMLRLVQVWGGLLASFHLKGLRGVRGDVTTRSREIASEVAEARKDLARHAWEHAASLEKAYAAFRQLAKEWQR